MASRLRAVFMSFQLFAWSELTSLKVFDRLEGKVVRTPRIWFEESMPYVTNVIWSKLDFAYKKLSFENCLTAILFQFEKAFSYPQFHLQFIVAEIEINSSARTRKMLAVLSIDGRKISINIPDIFNDLEVISDSSSAQRGQIQ